jgi:hypothetical protein
MAGSVVGGCGPKGPPGAIRVDGTVVQASVPVPKGVVHFVGQGGTAAGSSRIVDGRFSLMVKPGDYRLGITAQQEIYDSQGNSAGFKNLLPEKYLSAQTSGLTTTVDANHRTVAIALDR